MSATFKGELSIALVHAHLMPSKHIDLYLYRSQNEVVDMYFEINNDAKFKRMRIKMNILNICSPFNNKIISESV